MGVNLHLEWTSFHVDASRRLQPSVLVGIYWPMFLSDASRSNPARDTKSGVQFGLAVAWY
jgi:hypothetical protein